MRNLHSLNHYRSVADEFGIYGALGDESCGCFLVPQNRHADLLRIVASSDGGWDHVSVSLANRCPTWSEMDKVKRLFFHPHEVVMQLHPEEKNHISIHPYTLHLWRPQREPIPLPPTQMI